MSALDQELKKINDLYLKGRKIEKYLTSYSLNSVNSVELSTLFSQTDFQNYIEELKKLIQSENINLKKIGELACRFHPPWNIRKFSDLLVPIERFIQKQIADDELLQHDQPDKNNDPMSSNQVLHKIKLILIADHIRSAFNVGALFRCADGFGVEKIILTGYSPTPENNSTIAKTALGTHEYTPWEHIESTLQAIKKLKDLNYTIYALETTSQATPIQLVKWKTPIAIIVGNERFGLNPEILKSCDEIIKINMYGNKNSINVATAFAIVAHQVQLSINP